MGAITTIVLNDAAATPVAHTFSPARQGLQGPNISVADFEDRASNGGIPVGYYRISTSFSRPNKDRKSFRIGITMSVPVMETLSNNSAGIIPAPTVAYQPLAILDVVLPERSSVQVRKDLRKMFYELLNDPQVKKMIEDLDYPY